MKLKTKIIISLIGVGLIGFGIGWAVGFSNAVDLCAKFGAKFIELTGFEVDPEAIKTLMTQYSQRFMEKY